MLSVIQAKKEGLAEFILCGDRAKIAELLRRHGGSDCRLRDHDTPGRRRGGGARSSSWRRQNKLQLILKGFLPTATLMKPILDKEKGLRSGNLLSDILVVENPAANYRRTAGLERRRPEHPARPGPEKADRGERGRGVPPPGLRRTPGGHHGRHRNGQGLHAGHPRRPGPERNEPSAARSPAAWSTGRWPWTSPSRAKRPSTRASATTWPAAPRS